MLWLCICVCAHRYQKLWKSYVKLRHLLANSPKVKQIDKQKLTQRYSMRIHTSQSYSRDTFDIEVINESIKLITRLRSLARMTRLLVTTASERPHPFPSLPYPVHMHMSGQRGCDITHSTHNEDGMK